jgi:hypothetical protein
LLGKPEGKKSLLRYMRRWENNTKMHVNETAWECEDWIHKVERRDHRQAVVCMVMNLRIPLMAGICWL